MKQHSTNGFTLIEMIVTVVIVMILAAVAVPSFNYVYETTRTNSSISSIESSLSFARNQAVSFGRVVSVCPGDGTGCSDNWISGFNIFIDDDENGVVDNNTDILRFVDAFNSRDFIKASSEIITFGADGLLIPSSSKNIIYCPKSADSENSKQILISASGRIKTITTGVNCN
ncbi:GspH/FimT family pseudopilin [Shewanella sp. 10N.286.52.B9]|uniref:GspH/FimT family pseudopilin n=1 Tax=Shewanella sp. 10N.286.52.B9 TaxID=1880837 RepID=UPI000C828188|nr:GspH/FimT family pseudopilin [Shewanella sp. 10N.286.52.B9]PMG43204.1 hypothetical protein BCU91_06540 [Shewanella sp. 10N.286.52.B9]